MEAATAAASRLGTAPLSWALSHIVHLARGTLQKTQGAGCAPLPPPSLEELSPTECPRATRPFFPEVELRSRKGVTKVTRPGVPAGGDPAQTPALPRGRREASGA